MKHYIYIKDKETNEVYKWTTTDRVVNNMDFFAPLVRMYKRRTAVAVIRQKYMRKDQGKFQDEYFYMEDKDLFESYLDAIDSKEKNMMYLGTSVNPILGV